MNAFAKVFVVFLCLLLCMAGVIVAPGGDARTDRQKPDATPVKNHEAIRRVLLQA